MNIIDAHAYVGESLFDLHQTPEQLLAKMNNCDVNQAVIGPNKPKGYDLKPANRMIGDLVSRYPNRFRGYVRVDPWQGDAALDELKRGYEEMGLVGLLLHPWEELFQIANPILNPLIEYAIDNKMPVLVEAGYPLVSHPLDIAELATRYPEVNIIATHGLQLDSAAFALTDAEVAMRECNNIFMETSGMYAPDVMEKLVQGLGIERLIFGSHTPWFNLELEVERVNLLNLSPNEKMTVMCGNISRLLGLNN